MEEIVKSFGVVNIILIVWSVSCGYKLEIRKFDICDLKFVLQPAVTAYYIVSTAFAFMVFSVRIVLSFCIM